MKHSMRLTLLLSFGLISLAHGQIANPIAPDGTNCAATAVSNPNQLALLRWYGANVTASFLVGGGPLGMAFDGSSLWIVNPGTSSVSKLRASDGGLLGTFTVGYIPGYAAFDGANIWVTNLGDNTVSKLRASDGATLGTFPTGTYPWGIAFDGTSVWVGNILDSTASKFRPSDGALLGVFPAGRFPISMVFDGSNLWFTNQGGANTVTKLRTHRRSGVGNISGRRQSRGCMRLMVRQSGSLTPIAIP